jgi:hypothetical protein
VAPDGAYGFFARLTSNLYAPSDPFLVVFNRNVSNDKMDDAALAINLAALDPIPGDYDNNRVVELADYEYWRQRFGNNAAPSTSPDGNGNGVVDAADYIIWRNAFNQSGVGTVASEWLTIPEPCSTLLAMAALVFGCWSARRRRIFGPSR